MNFIIKEDAIALIFRYVLLSNVINISTIKHRHRHPKPIQTLQLRQALQDFLAVPVNPANRVFATLRRKFLQVQIMQFLQANQRLNRPRFLDIIALKFNFF